MKRVCYFPFKKLPNCVVNAEFCYIAMQCKRREKWKSTCAKRQWITCHCQVTNFTVQRGWALFSSGRNRPLFPSCTADIKKTDCVAEQRMFLSLSVWAKPPNPQGAACKTSMPEFVR